MDTTPSLSLPYIAPSQAQKHVTHNEALAMLDALVQLAVLDRHLAAPPPSPNDGDCYIVAAGAAGDWVGQTAKVAALQDGVWLFITPQPGWRAFAIDENLLLYWNGSTWLEVESRPSQLQNMSLLGIGTTADGANPFAAKLNKALWTAKPTAEGGDGDLHYTLNKETSADVLSLLFQSGWSGRAEIGLIGDNDLTIRVSADGASWIEVLRGDHSTGEAVIGNLRVGCDMVQNVLPDSGRFNGNANNAVFNGIAYTAPSYISPISGGSFASHAKFIHDNADYGGAGAALDPEVKALIDKIRPVGGRRFGPEWYVLKMTQTAGALTASQLVGGVAHGLINTSAFTALPNKFTIGYYVKVKTGSAAIGVNSARVTRAAIDGVPVAAGTGSTIPLVNADGWKYINLESTPNQYSYDNAAFQILASVSSELYFAMPKITFGHASLDPDLGVLMNAKMFG